ncbi:glucose-1-phosphate cytidylyltransferase [Patescibacteria group bacterium]|nr:glucose-1-phosphate cytidylyltransferase [Patescibacteria group bacterium]
MKVVILAGGLGTRLSEETTIKPKPMVEIGGKPILWHIMKIYSSYGFNDFIICLGYKGYLVKEYFANYFLHESDVTFNFKDDNKITFHQKFAEPWEVTLIDTGLNTMTGGRIKRIKDYVENNTFFMTYGDGVSNINIKDLLKFHKTNNKIVTVTAVQPLGRFGSLNIDNNDLVKDFVEKPIGDGYWINGGYFVLEPRIFKYIDGDSTVFEKEPLEKLAIDENLVAFKHSGFWQPMDTLRDKTYLEELWKDNSAPWKIW